MGVDAVVIVENSRHIPFKKFIRGLESDKWGKRAFAWVENHADVWEEFTDERRARRFLQPYLSGSFHEIGAVTTVLGVEEIERMHQALSSIQNLLQEIFT